MIKTRLRPENPEANLKSYYEVYRGFSWSFVKDLFPSYSSGYSNIVSESVDRWAADRNSCDRTALIFEYAGEVQRLTYADLKINRHVWLTSSCDTAFVVVIRS